MYEQFTSMPNSHAVKLGIAEIPSLLLGGYALKGAGVAGSKLAVYGSQGVESGLSTIGGYSLQGQEVGHKELVHAGLNALLVATISRTLGSKGIDPDTVVAKSLANPKNKGILERFSIADGAMAVGLETLEEFTQGVSDELIRQQIFGEGLDMDKALMAGTEGAKVAMALSGGLNAANQLVSTPANLARGAVNLAHYAKDKLIPKPNLDPDSKHYDPAGFVRTQMDKAFNSKEEVDKEQAQQQVDEAVKQTKHRLGQLQKAVDDETDPDKKQQAQQRYDKFKTKHYDPMVSAISASNDAINANEEVRKSTVSSKIDKLSNRVKAIQDYYGLLKTKPTQEGESTPQTQEPVQPQTSTTQQPQATTVTVDGSTLFVGDSIAVGLGGDSNAKVGDNPKKVLQRLNKMDIKAGQSVVLSTGLSNNSSDMGNVKKQLKLLKDKGANVVVLGVAENFKDKPKQAKALNNQLQKLAKANGFGFKSIGNYAKGDGSKAHPNYKAISFDDVVISPAIAKDPKTNSPQATPLKVDVAGFSYDSSNKKRRDLILGTYKALVNAGFTDGQARYYVGEINREGGFNGNTAFGSHRDQANGETNLGFISWQEGRQRNLVKFLKQNGVTVTKGKVPQTQRSLDLMALFFMKEHRGDYGDVDYKKAPKSHSMKNFLATPNPDRNDHRWGYRSIGWAYGQKKLSSGKAFKEQDHIANIWQGFNDINKILGDETYTPTATATDTAVDSQTALQETQQGIDQTNTILEQLQQQEQTEAIQQQIQELQAKKEQQQKDYEALLQQQPQSAEQTNNTPQFKSTPQVEQAQAEATKELTKLLSIMTSEDLEKVTWLDDKTKEAFRQLIEIKQAIKGNAVSEVAEQIVNGKHTNIKDPLANNLGTKDYTVRLSQALEVGDTQQIKRYMGHLNRWVDNHTNKADALQNAFEQITQAGQTVYVAPTQDNNWIEVDSSEPHNALSIHAGSGNFIKRIREEATQLQSFADTWNDNLSAVLGEDFSQIKTKSVKDTAKPETIQPPHAVKPQGRKRNNATVESSEPKADSKQDTDKAQPTNSDTQTPQADKQNADIGYKNSQGKIQSLSTVNNPKAQADYSNNSYLNSPYKITGQSGKYTVKDEQELTKRYFADFNKAFATNDVFARSVLGLKGKSVSAPKGSATEVIVPQLEQLLDNLPDDISQAREYLAKGQTNTTNANANGDTDTQADTPPAQPAPKQLEKLKVQELTLDETPKKQATHDTIAKISKTTKIRDFIHKAKTDDDFEVYLKKVTTFLAKNSQASLDKSDGDVLTDSVNVLLQEKLSEIFGRLHDLSDREKRFVDTLTAIQQRLKFHLQSNDAPKELVDTLLAMTEDLEALVNVGLINKTIAQYLDGITVEKGKQTTSIYQKIKQAVGSFFKFNQHTADTLFARLLNETTAFTANNQPDEDSGYSFLQGDSKAEQATPFVKRNHLVASFSQQFTTNLSKHKDMAIKLSADLQSGLNSLTDVDYNDLDSNQVKALEHFLTFNQQMVSYIDNSFRKKTFANDDLKTYFVDESGKTDGNVYTAMALAIYDYLATNGTARYATQKQLKDFLKLDEYAIIPPAVAKQLSPLGKSRDLVAQDIGGSIVNLLGLKADDNAPMDTHSRLAGSLGIWAISAMSQAGLIDIATVKGEQINTHFEHKPFNDRAELGFVKVTDKDNNVRAINEQIAQASSKSKQVLSEVFGLVSLKRYPTTIKPTKVNPKLKRSTATLSKKQQEQIDKAQSYGYKINDKVHDVFVHLNKHFEEDFLATFGAFISQEQANKLHITDVDNAIAKADNSHREWLNYLDYANSLERTETGFEVFYDTVSTFNNNRMSPNSNVVNVQNSKLHRSLIDYDHFSHTINTKEAFVDGQGKPTAHGYFIHAILERAEGTEKYLKDKLPNYNAHTADKVKVSALIPAFMEYLKENSTAKAGIKSMQNLIKGSTNKQDMANVSALVDDWEMGAESLRALIELAYYGLAKKSGSYTTAISSQSDGVNNGIMLSMYTYAGFDIPPENVGVLNKDTGYQSFLDTQTNADILDFYRGFIKPFSNAVDNEIVKLQQKVQEGVNLAWKINLINAFKQLHPKLAERKTLKNILIPFVYNAGVGSMSRSLGYAVLNQVKADFVVLSVTPNQAKYNQLQEQLRIVLNERNFSLPNANQLKDFWFSPKQEAQFIKAFTDSYKPIVKSAITDYVPKLKYNRETMMSVHNQIVGIFLQAYKLKLEQAQERLKEQVAKDNPLESSKEWFKSQYDKNPQTLSFEE